MLTKYANYNGKISSIQRYCKITDCSFKYYKNKIQGTEWLAKPLGEFSFNVILDVNPIKIENKKDKSYHPGFELIIGNENNSEQNAEPQKIYFTAENEKDSLNWVATIKRFTEKEGNID